MENLQLVQMKVTTRWDDVDHDLQVLQPGDCVSVDEKTLKRWERKGIAERYDASKEEREAKPFATEEYLQKIGIMKRPELMEECKNLGIKFLATDTNNVLIARLLNERS